MQATWNKYKLNFKQIIGTSRGTMQNHNIWFIFITYNNITGIGECAPLPNLSLDNLAEIESKLDFVCNNISKYFNSPNSLKNDFENYPAIRFAVELAFLDLKNKGCGQYFKTNLQQNVENTDEIDINGLIWMGESDFIKSQIDNKLTENWKCIKIKIGNLDFTKELEFLKQIREQLPKEKLTIRLDANGAFDKTNVFEKLNMLSKYDIHSIEQPVMAGQFELMSDICKNSPIPIALDEELIKITSNKKRQEMLDFIKPQYIILKPSLVGGFLECESWINLAKQRNINYWLTSALESNIALKSIAQWVVYKNIKGFQGLGTGKLYTNNIPCVSFINSSNKLVISNDKTAHNLHKFNINWLNSNKDIELKTSGSTGKPKTINALKQDLINSSLLSAKIFKLQKNNTALLCLPIDYIAGKMMVVRSFIIGLDLKIIKPCSNPMQNITESFDFVAMTPMQAENLSIKTISKIKILIIGGAKISFKLENFLNKINKTTEIYETYGMTETYTHIAIRKIESGQKNNPTQKIFKALDGITFKIDKRGCLIVNNKHLSVKKTITNDLVEIYNEKSFKLLGRVDNIINSGGIKIIPEQIEEKIKLINNLNFRIQISSEKDNILGEKIILIVENQKKITLKELNFTNLNNYEIPKKIINVNEFKETKSGKIIRT